MTVDSPSCSSFSRGRGSHANLGGESFVLPSPPDCPRSSGLAVGCRRSDRIERLSAAPLVARAESWLPTARATSRIVIRVDAGAVVRRLWHAAQRHNAVVLGAR